MITEDTVYHYICTSTRLIPREFTVSLSGGTGLVDNHIVDTAFLTTCFSIRHSIAWRLGYGYASFQND